MRKSVVDFQLTRPDAYSQYARAALIRHAPSGLRSQGRGRCSEKALPQTGRRLRFPREFGLVWLDFHRVDRESIVSLEMRPGRLDVKDSLTLGYVDAVEAELVLFGTRALLNLREGQLARGGRWGDWQPASVRANVIGPRIRALAIVRVGCARRGCSRCMANPPRAKPKGGAFGRISVQLSCAVVLVLPQGNPLGRV